MKIGWLLVVVVAACGSEGKKAEAPPGNTAPAETAPAPRRDDDLEAQRMRAEAEYAYAMKAAQEAIEKVEALQRELDDLSARTGAAIDSLVAAQNDADRSAAKAKLEALRKEQAEMKMKLEAAKARAQRAQRKQGTPVSAECLDNPLAKGCT